MSAGINIINIDESTLYSTDNRKFSWGSKNKRLFLSRARRLFSASSISATTSKGEFYFTLSQGKNNSYTLLLFVIKLVRHLNMFKKDWRYNTVFMLDMPVITRSFFYYCFI